MENFRDLLRSRELILSLTSVVFIWIIILLSLSSASGQANGDYRSRQTGNWATLNTWQRFNAGAWAIPTGGQGYPGQNAGTGTVTIQNTHTVTLNVSPANNIGVLVVGQGTSGILINTAVSLLNLSTTGNLTVNAGGSFAFSSLGNLTIGGTTQINGTFIDNDFGIGVDTFNGLVTIGATGTWTTTTVTAEIQMDFNAGVTNSGTFNGGGMQLGPNTICTANTNINLGSGLDTDSNATIAGAGTVSVTGDRSNIGTVTTGNLTISGNLSISSTNGGAPVLDITGNLIISSGGSLTMAPNSTNMTVTGTTSISGSFTDNDAANGITTFTGRVTLNAGGSFTTTVVTNVANLLFLGGITHDGTTFNAGAATFSTNSQTITGSGTLNFANTITITAGETITNTATITMTNTAAGSLTGGAGAIFTQGVNGVLNYAGQTITVPTLNASNTGNTVNYSRAGVQTIFNPNGSNYYNLSISVSGTKTLGANTNILGDLTVQNSATLDLNGSDLVITDDLSVLNTAILDADANNSDITIAGDWTISSTAADPFLEGTRTVTFNGTVNQIIAGTAFGARFFNLTINNSSASPSITLNNNVITAGTLNLNNGNINLNTRDLQIGTSAAATGTLVFNAAGGGWLYGGTHTRYLAAATIAPSLANLAGAFIMGNTTDFRPIYLYPTTIPTAGGTIRVQYNSTETTTALVPTVNDGGTPIVLRHNSSWVVSNVTLTGGAYAIYAGGTGFVVGNVNDIRLMRSNSVVGTAGTNLNFVGVPFAQRLNLTVGELTNTFYLGSINATQTPLPIELLYFKADTENDVVRTEWSTAQETDNHFFTVERTIDFETFDEVGVIESKGNSHEQRSYSFIDKAPLYGKSYYRLKQTDFDGKFTYSKPVMIHFDGPVSVFMDVYPNPFDGNRLNLELKGLANDTEVSVQIYNQQGQSVYEKVYTQTSSGMISATLDFNTTLPQGIYIIKAGKTLQLTHKIVVK